MSINLINFAYYDSSKNIINIDNKEKLMETFKNYNHIKINTINIVRIYNINKYIIQDINKLLSLINEKNIDNNIPLKYLNIIYDDNCINNIKLNLINTTNGNHYNGWHNRTQYGYHSFQISNIKLLGQRQPNIRLNKIKKYIDFNNKTIIDFGCNTGGMIFHLPELKKAYGFDFNNECINSCKFMASLFKYNTNYVFKHQDLNSFDFKKFTEENKIEKVDIIYLLSLGSWIQNWRNLYKDSILYSDNIILETNNDTEGKPQLDFFKSLNCNIKMISDKSDDDTTNNFGRKTYLISKII